MVFSVHASFCVNTARSSFVIGGSPMEISSIVLVFIKCSWLRFSVPCAIALGLGARSKAGFNVLSIAAASLIVWRW